MLKMTDESGVDAKIIAVPHDKLTPMYRHVQQLSDLPELLLKQITHFFEHYKDLEPGKWVKVEGMEDAKAAKEEIIASQKRFEKS
jgi:inorganic pyrophosphatase